MNEPPSRWNPEMRPETPPPQPVQAHSGAPHIGAPRAGALQGEEISGTEGAEDGRSEAQNDAFTTRAKETHAAEPEESLSASLVHSPAFSTESLVDVELQALVGAGSAFHGTLSFTGQVRIDGELEGVARGGRLLVVGHGARVRGRIEAEHVIILGGRVEADIVASHSIELHVPAEVTGELRSPQIYMDRGVQFQGTCDMTTAPPGVEFKREESVI